MLNWFLKFRVWKQRSTDNFVFWLAEFFGSADDPGEKVRIFHQVRTPLRGGRETRASEKPPWNKPSGQTVPVIHPSSATVITPVLYYSLFTLIIGAYYNPTWTECIGYLVCDSFDLKWGWGGVQPDIV